MIFIYAENELDITVEPISLNGRPGGVSLTDSEDDLDITFENIRTARAWAKKLTKKLEKFEATS